MTDAGSYILAADDVDGMIKLAFWVVIILIFVTVKVVRFLGRLISPSTAKPATAPPPMRNVKRPPPLPSRAPSSAGAIALPPLPTKGGAKVRRKVARKVPSAQAPAIPANPLGGIVGALQQTRIAPSSPPPVAVPRSRVAGWLDSRTIRAQFVLSEAMKPPVSEVTEFLR